MAEWGFILFKQTKGCIMGIPDKNINGTDWSSVNVLSGLPIGTPMAIQLKTNAMIILFESDTKPSAQFKGGVLVSNIFNEDSTKIITANSQEIWAKCANDYDSAIINIQEIGGI